MLDLSTPAILAAPDHPDRGGHRRGVEELWEVIGRHRDHQAQEGTLDSRRRERLQREFRNVLVARIEDEIDRLCDDGRFARLADDVVDRKIDPYRAAEDLIEHVGDSGDSGDSGDTGSRSRRDN